MKPCSTSYCLTNFCGRLRCQARLALSWQDANLSCMQWERPHDMAQCHDYLDIKMVDVETGPKCNVTWTLRASCLLTALGVVLAGIAPSAPVGCQRKEVEGKGGKGRWRVKEKLQTGVNVRRVLISYNISIRFMQASIHTHANFLHLVFSWTSSS